MPQPPEVDWILLLVCFVLFFITSFFFASSAGERTPRAIFLGIVMAFALDFVLTLGWLISKGLLASLQ